MRINLESIKKLPAFFVKFWALFILIEVLWMLLPFAGFLYGSVFQMQTLNRNPSTAWLSHFVFPVHTFFPLGIVLMSLGFLIFVVGATQIYTAKFRRTGLVTSGIYRKIRHPQYMALVLFGVGTLLTWGRFITFIAFFIMMFLYYRLALSEERHCERLFGAAYDNYKRRTYFLFPGERWTARAWERVPGLPLPRWITLPVHFLAVLLLAVVLGFFIQSLKVRFQTVPFITAELDALPTVSAGGIIPFIASRDGRLVFVQGPFGPAQKRDFAEKLLEMISHSQTLSKKLSFLNRPGLDRAVILPGSPGGMPEKPLGERSKVQLFIVQVRPTEPRVETSELLADPGQVEFVSAIAATLDPTMLKGRDPITSLKDHPLVGIAPRWMNMLDAVRQRTPALGGDVTKGPPKLILVQAPLYRARDKSFAQEIMGRLLRSEILRKILARYQVGGDVLAVAFPRPGPNWYREHHGIPQIGAFVMLVRKKAAISDEALFRHDMKAARKLEGAFIVEMDFAVPPPRDPVYEGPFVIGLLRDLEERWDFFLSGVE